MICAEAVLEIAHRTAATKNTFIPTSCGFE
jgi:hypothetical protein